MYRTTVTGGRFAVLIVAAALAVGACATSTESRTPAVVESAGQPTGSPASTQPPKIPIIIDTDLGADDVMAISYLLRDPGVDVRAITIAGTGLVHCGPGARNARNLLGAFGRGAIPVACGLEAALGGGEPFPAEWRAVADDGYGLDLPPTSSSSAGMPSLDLLRTTVESAPDPITLVTLGPLTNIAELFRADPSIAGRLSAIHLMAGAVDAPGNVFSPDAAASQASSEWNMHADPAAAAVVLAAGVPMTIVPLDASDDLPLSTTFFDKLATDHAAAGADIAYELLARNPSLLGGGDYFWDQLAAVTLTDQGVATFETAKIRIVEGDGAEAGRTIRDEAGTGVRFASAADPARFEARLLEGLRRGAPRPNPFTLRGTIAVRFDASLCGDELPSTVAAGTWAVDLDAALDGSNLVAAIRLHEGATWQQVLDYIATADQASEPPTFVDVLGTAVRDGAGAARVVVDLTPGTYGVVCINYRDPPLVHAADAPFEAAG